MQTRFVDTAQHADALFVICAISSLGKSLIAVAAENLLKKQRWSTAAFLPEETAALPLFASDKKSSGASGAAVGEQRRCAHHC